jgi:hypothetical protein
VTNESRGWMPSQIVILPKGDSGLRKLWKGHRSESDEVDAEALRGSLLVAHRHEYSPGTTHSSLLALEKECPLCRRDTVMSRPEGPRSPFLLRTQNSDSCLVPFRERRHMSTRYPAKRSLRSSQTVGRSPPRGETGRTPASWRVRRRVYSAGKVL